MSDMSDQKITFPEGFLWGSASASHQVEGNCVHNQWWEFEQKPGRIKNGDKSGIACDHYNRYEEDFNMLRELNHNAHRISLEWSRFYPETPEELNKGAVEHYHKVLDKLIELGIEPFVTTFHFTLPLWFAKRGGFEKNTNIKYYERFCELLAKEYKGKIKCWNTINEPSVYTFMSYYLEEFPPAKNNLIEALTVLKNLMKAHAKVYNIIKSEDDKNQVGIVKHMASFVAKNTKNPFDRMASSITDWVFNGSLINAIKTGDIAFPLGVFESYDYIKNSSDFIGLNYYTRKFCTLNNLGGSFTKTGDEKTTKMGWTVFPEGIYHNLKTLHKELGLPVYITENGIATDDDEWKTEFIKIHLREIHRSINEGIDVKGYFYWSNMDNFEWADGYGSNFGLIEIERENNLNRKIRKSALDYADIIKNNGFNG